MQHRLHQAILTSDVIQVRELLRFGCDVNYYTRDEYNLGCTYLHLSRNSIITRDLLLHGAQIDGCNCRGVTPLEYAIIEGKGLAIVKVFLAFGADISTRAYHILKFAILSKNTDIIYELIDRMESNILTYCFYDYEFLSRRELLILRSKKCYSLAYNYFLERLNPIWKKEIWSLINADSELIKEKFNSFIMFNNNEDYVKNCMKEMLNLRLYKFGELTIPDLLKLTIYDRTQQPFLNKLKFSEILRRFPIYGRNIVTHIEQFIKRRNLMNDLENLTLSSEKKDTGKQIILNIYCMREISTYLNNNDLENFTKALQNHDEIP